MTNPNRELAKCKEIALYNSMDNKPFSNYAIEVYARSLVKDIKNVKKVKKK